MDKTEKDYDAASLGLISVHGRQALSRKFLAPGFWQLIFMSAAPPSFESQYLDRPGYLATLP